MENRTGSVFTALERCSVHIACWIELHAAFRFGAVREASKSVQQIQDPCAGSGRQLIDRPIPHLAARGCAVQTACGVESYLTAGGSSVGIGEGVKLCFTPVALEASTKVRRWGQFKDSPAAVGAVSRWSPGCNSTVECTCRTKDDASSWSGAIAGRALELVWGMK